MSVLSCLVLYSILLSFLDLVLILSWSCLVLSRSCLSFLFAPLIYHHRCP
jgi:hypothetical protein